MKENKVCSVKEKPFGLEILTAVVFRITDDGMAEVVCLNAQLVLFSRFEKKAHVGGFGRPLHYLKPGDGEFAFPCYMDIQVFIFCEERFPDARIFLKLPPQNGVVGDRKS